MLDGVELRGVISGQVFEHVTGFGNDILDILSLAESSVAHHDDARRRKFGQQVLRQLGAENIGIDARPEQSDGMQEFSDQHADDVCPFFGMPVLDAVASLFYGSISMRAWHIVGKPLSSM